MKIQYLGHVILEDLRSFIGITGYYLRFIEGFSKSEEKGQNFFGLKNARTILID